MATNYPGSLDTSTQQPSPSSSTEMDDSGFEHDVVHTNHSGAIIAVETKVGTGSSTAVASSVLGGTGSGTSAWTTSPTLGGLTVDTDTLHVDATNNRVGIGTTSPSVPLHILDDNHAIMRLQNEGTGNTEGPTVELYGNTGRMGLFGFDNSDDIRIKNETSDGKLFFFTNNSVRATVLADGKVGIGTDAPSNTFHVNGGTNNFVARFESTDGEVYIGLKDSATSSGGHVAIAAIGDDLVLRAGDNNAVRVKDDGDVGIGTTSPSARLHVDAGTTNLVGHFTSTDASALLTLADNNTSGINYVGIKATGDVLKLRSNNADQVEIETDGSIQALNGSASAPIFTFVSDTNTGMYRASTDRLGFTTGGTARMTIQNSSFGLTGSSGRSLSVKASGAIEMYRTATGANDGILALYSDNGSTTDLQWLVYGDGDTASDTGSYGSISDNRLKTNIAAYKDPTGDLMAINVIKYDLSKTSTGIDDNGDPIIVDRDESKTMTGWDAQQVQSVKPGFVKLDAERGIYSVKSSVFVPLLHRGFQVHEDKLTALEARIAALEAA